MNDPHLITLTEYQSQPVDQAELPEVAARLLRDHYHRQVQVEPPWFATDHRWRLTSQGWVGHLPLTPDLQLLLQPKVPLQNLFRMLEYAYLLDIERPKGLVETTSLAEFFERLARLLAEQLLARNRQGLYRTYLPKSEPLPFVRGRLDVRRMAQTPVRTAQHCHYEEHTADVEDNRIVAWTLWQISRSAICGAQTAPLLRRAFQALQGRVLLRPYPPQACLDRLYHRLNQDYRPMHALCRFFLEQLGPTHQLGDRTMLPFLVDMASLYELFVANWLQVHLPSDVRLKNQEQVPLGQAGNLHFRIDLVLYDAPTGQVKCVLDTKYKAASRPSTEDIQQMISYAHTTGSREAILVYPAPLPYPLDATIRGIRVRTLTFELAGDLEQAGQNFVQHIFNA